MNITEVAQWVIDNRYPKSEFEKLSDHELYHGLIEKIELVLSQNSVKPPVSGSLTLVEKLESRIKDCDCGFDDVSWGMQEGILISVREAKQLVALLRQ